MAVDRAALFIVTQVAPYGDGPAGVHGVLPQAAVALAELGAMAGLEPVIGLRRRQRSAPTMSAVAACWRCSPSGRPRGRPTCEAPSSTACASGPPGDPRRPFRHRLVSVVGRLRRLARRPLRRPPLDAELRGRRHRAGPSRHGASREHMDAATTRCICFATCVPTPRCCCVWPTASSTWTRPGPRCPPAGSRCRGVSPKERAGSSTASLGHFPGAWESPDLSPPPGRRLGVGARPGLKRSARPRQARCSVQPCRTSVRSASGGARRSPGRRHTARTWARTRRSTRSCRAELQAK